jgi:hypothetical protein
MKMSRKFPKLNKGDPLMITWWDIVSDAIGDVKDAEPALCQTMGFFEQYKGRGKSRSLVTALTLFPKETGEVRGWDVYPVGCIERIEILISSHLTGPVFKRNPDEKIKPAEVQTIRGQTRP